MTHGRYQMGVSNISPNSLCKFQASHGRLCQFMIVVHATMVMHFQHFQQNYGTDNLHTKVMIDSVRTSFEICQTSAINMLQHYPKVVNDGFRQATTAEVDGDTDGNILLKCHCFHDQLLKVNIRLTRFAPSWP